MTNTDIQAAYVGSSEAVRMYLGTDIVWEKQSPVPPGPDLPYSAQPFTIEITDTSDGNEINFFKIVPTANTQTAATNAPDKTLYYTINKPFTDISTWTANDNPWKSNGQYVVHVLQSNGSITGLSSGDTVRFYTFVGSRYNEDYPDLGGGPFGASGKSLTSIPDNVPTNSFGHSTVSCIVYGNIMSLITGEWFEYYLGNASLITPITQFQQLSWASSTGSSTARNIFLGLFCTSGASTNKMNLYDAQNLVLPQDVRPGCYNRMFSRSKVMNSPALPALDMTFNCYSFMFAGCYSLTGVSSLPAENLAANCYHSMFSGCTSLENAPALPATNLLAYCYQNMFSGCRALMAAPALPATSLNQGCYISMFQGCFNMTGTPVLPATTLPNACYSRMFNGCRQISEIICLATNPTTGACNSWLQGASSTGTFYKASGVTWTSGTSGIPTGWTTEDYVEPAAENTGQ